MDWHKKILDASEKIKPYLLHTPLMYSPYFSAKIDEGRTDQGPKTKVYLKLEREQVTGSFKARGAMNKIASCLERGEEKSFTTASTGILVFIFFLKIEEIMHLFSVKVIMQLQLLMPW